MICLHNNVLVNQHRYVRNWVVRALCVTQLWLYSYLLSHLLELVQLASGDSPETVLDCGLVKGHAYCVTDVKKVICYIG